MCDAKFSAVCFDHLLFILLERDSNTKQVRWTITHKLHMPIVSETICHAKTQYCAFGNKVNNLRLWDNGFVEIKTDVNQFPVCLNILWVSRELRPITQRSGFV